MAVVISPRFVVQSTVPVDVTVNYARLLIDNVFRRGTVSASSEATDENGWLENAIDGLTFDWWQPETLPAWLQTEITASPVDCGLIAAHNSLTFVFQYYNGSAWVDLHEPIASGTNATMMVLFSEVTATKFRIRITDAEDASAARLGVVMLGLSTQIPSPFYGGFAPLTLNRRVQRDVMITEGGFEKGVSVLRTGSGANIKVRHVAASWVRDNLGDINNDLMIYPFGFAWRPDERDTDVAYCWLNKPIKATNSGVGRGLMDLDMDIEAYVGGGARGTVTDTFFAALASSPYALAMDIDESGVLSSSSPSSGLSGEAKSIAVHPSGLVAVAASSGSAVYQYSAGEWTLLQALPAATAVSIHPSGKWMLIGHGSISLYERMTINDPTFYLKTPDFASLYYSAQGASALFSPDGSMVAITQGLVVSTYRFDISDGSITFVESLGVGLFGGRLEWSPDSIKLAAANGSDSPRFRIFIRDLDDDTMTGWTGPTIYPQQSPGALTWHPDSNMLIAIGGDDNVQHVLVDDGTNTYTDEYATIMPDAPGVGGRTFSAATKTDGTILLVGNANGNAVIYSYDGNVYTRETTANLTAGTNDLRFRGMTYNPIGTTDPTGYGWSTLLVPADVVFSEDNYRVTRTDGSTTSRPVRAALAQTGGKWAIRARVMRGADIHGPSIGISSSTTIGNYLGDAATGWGLLIDRTSGSEFAYNDNTGIDLGDLGDFSSELEVMIEVDLDNGKLWFGVDGVWYNGGEPHNDLNETYNNLTGDYYYLYCDMQYKGYIELVHPDDFVTAASDGFAAGWPGRG